MDVNTRILAKAGIVDIARCKISKFVQAIQEPPFLVVQVGTMEIPRPETDDCFGRELGERIKAGCRSKGLQYRYHYEISDEKYDFDVIVL